MKTKKTAIGFRIKRNVLMMFFVASSSLTALSQIIEPTGTSSTIELIINQGGAVTFSWSGSSASAGLAADQIYLRKSGTTDNIAHCIDNYQSGDFKLTPNLTGTNGAHQLDPNTEYVLYGANANYAKGILLSPSGYWNGTPGREYYRFTTGADDLAPSVMRKSPVAGTTGISSIPNLSLTFDEVVVAGTGSIYIRKYSDNAVAQTVSLASVTFTESTTPLPRTTISFSGGTLSNSTQYYVDIPSGVFKDDSDNVFAGINDKNWSFTTGVGDQEAPSILWFAPADATTNISVGHYSLNVGYNESVVYGSGTAELRNAANTVIKSYGSSDFPGGTGQLHIN